jgi:hypothetical protein
VSIHDWKDAKKIEDGFHELKICPLRIHGHESGGWKISNHSDDNGPAMYPQEVSYVAGLI